MSFKCLFSNSVWKMESKQKVLSLKEKVELINFAKNGRGCREIAKEFDIGKTQASLILKWKAEILQEWLWWKWLFRGGKGCPNPSDTNRQRSTRKCWVSQAVCTYVQSTCITGHAGIFGAKNWLHLVMFRLSPIIDCRSIIAKNSDYRSKISKIDHRKQMYKMRNVENRMHSVRIGYNLQYGGTHRLE